MATQASRHFFMGMGNVKSNFNKICLSAGAAIEHYGDDAVEDVGNPHRY